MTEMRPQFDAAGARLTVVTGTDNGAAEFLEEAWKGGELYIDEEESFKKALHTDGGQLSAWWLLKPWVLKDVVSFARRFGSSTSDITDSKTQMLGGTMVIKNGQVVWIHRETSSFYNGDANEILAAVVGTSASTVSATPATAAAVTCDKLDSSTSASTK